MMRHEVVGDLFLFWKDAESITDAEWAPAMEDVASHRAASLKVLVVTLGGAPSPSQQVKLASLKQRKSMTLAVVSSSIGVRFVASSIALFARQIRTFVPSELPRAYAFLELSEAQMQAANAFFAAQPLE